MRSSGGLLEVRVPDTYTFIDTFKDEHGTWVVEELRLPDPPAGHIPVVRKRLQGQDYHEPFSRHALEAVKNPKTDRPETFPRPPVYPQPAYSYDKSRRGRPGNPNY